MAPKQTVKREELKSVVIEMRRELARKIAAHAPSLGENPTAVPGLALYRRTAPTPCYRATYEPSLTVFVQGRKRINLGGTVYICDASSFLLTSIDVPAESQILEASERVPMLTMNLRLDMPTVREVLSREIFPSPKPRPSVTGLLWASPPPACWPPALASSTFSPLPTTFHFSATSFNGKSSTASSAPRRQNASAPSPP